jgi:branched-chain amino acid transport system permease protein
MYEIVVSINIGIFILLSLSLNIITGYTGQPSLGHAAFFGIGAYTAAVATGKMGMSFWMALPAAFVITGLVGTLLGLASLRVKEDFLAITTIGINFVMVAIFHYTPYLGASFGMPVNKPLLAGKEMSNYHFLALVIILIVLVCLLSRRIERSWIGLALGGIRNNEEAAASVGIDVNRFKIIAFTIGTAIAGLTGAVYAHYMTFIYSSDFAFLTSITILSMLVVGGMGTIRGAIAGAVILGLAPELFRFISDYRMLVYGSILVLMMRFQPQGLLGDDSFVWTGIKRLRRLRAAGDSVMERGTGHGKG